MRTDTKRSDSSCVPTTIPPSLLISTPTHAHTCNHTPSRTCWYHKCFSNEEIKAQQWVFDTRTTVKASARGNNLRQRGSESLLTFPEARAKNGLLPWSQAFFVYFQDFPVFGPDVLRYYQKDKCLVSMLDMFFFLLPMTWKHKTNVLVLIVGWLQV